FGSAAPPILGALRDATGSYDVALLVIVSVLVVSAGVLVLLPSRRLSPSPAEQAGCAPSHLPVVGTLSAPPRGPGDDPVGIRDVAGLAVHAVLVVDHERAAAGRLRVVDHLVDRRRAEVLAGIAVLLGAARRADVGIRDLEVGRLVGLVCRAGQV